jgi:hypothetical protein
MSQEGKPKENNEKNKEELEQDRFNSLMDAYYEKRRKKSEAEKKAQEEKEKLEQASQAQKSTEQKSTENKKKKGDTPLNWIFAVD